MKSPSKISLPACIKSIIRFGSSSSFTATKSPLYTSLNKQNSVQKKMPIEMPKGLPFSVDTWTPCSDRKRYHFLTHAHKDHSQGISTHSSFPIYATHLTKILTLQYFPQLEESLFVDIEIGQPVVIDDGQDSSFTVTAFDANHCPGAVMFLFEGSFGNILHTGDCRLAPECLQSLPEKYLGRASRAPKCRLDYVFLDCTFGGVSLKMPSKHVAIRQVINCIWKHPDAPVVYLTCDLLGQEEILVNVSQAFGSKIFIDKESNPEIFQSLSVTVPEIISQDSSSRFHLFNGFPRLSERAETKLAEARRNFQPEPLIIRPSAQWFAHEEVSSETKKRRKERFTEAVRDQFGVWHVCYSMHSSREELEWALQLLAPRWVVSTTPSCRAMELNYVKENCFHSQLASDDPLWKLLDINVEATPCADASSGSSVYSSFVETCTGSKMQPIKSSVTRVEILNLSPGKGPPVTLFGRARLGLKDSILLEERKKPSIPHACNESVQQNISFRKEDVQEVKCNKSSKNTKEVDLDISETKFESSQETTKQIGKRAYSSFESSKNISENVRKMYRTMNVSVPRPLPSLVELLKDKKHAKSRSLF